MAKKSQRLRRERRIEKKKSQNRKEEIPIVDNSVMIEKMKEQLHEVYEEAQEEVHEEAHEEVFNNEIVEPKINLKMLLKRELLTLAKNKGLADITSKNTKAQIIAAIQNTD